MHAVVRGRVQGVGFRYFVRRAAADLGLNGWVRNQVDGSVEVEAEGDPSLLEQLVERLREGPALSRVEHVDVERSDEPRGYSGFEVLG